MDNWIWMEDRGLVWGGTFEQSASTLKAKTFGVLVELAEYRIKHYHSDLFHDAVWINEKMEGPIEFFWVVNDFGTFLGDEEFIKQVEKSKAGSEFWTYKLQLKRENGDHWTLSVWESLGDRVQKTESVVPEKTETKGNNMLDNLQEKLEEAAFVRDEIEAQKSEVEEALQEITQYIDDLENLIASLTDIPEVSIYLKLDLVSFDS